jgi:hypothetical protein
MIPASHAIAIAISVGPLIKGSVTRPRAGKRF